MALHDISSTKATSLINFVTYSNILPESQLRRPRAVCSQSCSSKHLTTFYAHTKMASNNYYGNTHSYDFNESLRPGNSQTASNTTSRNDLDSIYNKYSTPSPYHSLTPAPSYESTDRTLYNHPHPGYAESENGSAQAMDQYADNIPLKPSKQTPLRTDWRAGSAEYPPSPESQRDQGIGLVPQPPPKTKKGWFSGKIPWVVYTVSTVQIAIFIGEIIKNCQL